MEIRKTEIRSFRLSSNVIQKLKDASRQQGVSENAFVEVLLARRLELEPLLQALPWMAVSLGTVTSIVGAANRNELEMAGLDIGKRNFTLAKDVFESLGIEMTFAKYLTEVLDRGANWFRVQGATIGPERLTLIHSCGYKWSVFLQSYLAGAYEVISREKLKMQPRDAYLTVLIPQTPH